MIWHKGHKSVRRSTNERTRCAVQPGQLVSLEQLDALLDVTVGQFDRRVQKVIKDLRAKQARIDVPSARMTAIAPDGIGWTRLYEAQVQRLPRMDRAEEFVMARRYEFLRERARVELVRAGFEADALKELAGEVEAPVRLADADPLLLDAVRDFADLRNLYVERGLHLVLSSVYRYRGLGVDTVDLVQEGNASLFQAIDGFDWRRDVRFKTYAQYWIHQAILKVLYNASRTVRVPIWVQKALRKVRRAQEDLRLKSGGEPRFEVVAEAVGMTPQRVQELVETKRHAVSLDMESADAGASLGQMLVDENSVPVFEAIDDRNLSARLGEVMAELPERERHILQRRYGLEGRESETLGEIAADLGITAERVRQLQQVAIRRLRAPASMARLPG